jgi:hypothetical protein
MAMASGNLYDNSIIEASTKPSYKPNKKRRQCRQTNVEDGTEARYTTLGGAQSAVVIY